MLVFLQPDGFGSVAAGPLLAAVSELGSVWPGEAAGKTTSAASVTKQVRGKGTLETMMCCKPV